MPKRNFKKIIFKILRYLTKSRKRFRLNLYHKYLIFPLLVLFKISFTKELIITLIHSLISDNEFNAKKHDNLLIQQLKPLVIDSEDKHEESVDEYPEGDSCVVCKKPYDSTLFCVRRIVHCFGVTREPSGYYMMVTNFANEGDLNSYIKKRHQDLKWERIIRLSRDIAKALRGLHRKGLIHRDLHSGNILNHVTCNGITWTWLGDLGLSVKEEDVERLVMENGPLFGKIGYMAPEVLRCTQIYTKAADVYSFGMILWELTSCRMPFSNMRQDIHLIYEIIDGKRPKVVEGTPPAFAKLIEDCWQSDPNLRPTMEVVHKRIWSYANSMIKGNHKDKYGFRAAEEKRSLNLLKMVTMKQVYPVVINSQQIPKPPSSFARRFNQSEYIYRQKPLIKSNNGINQSGSHEYSCAIALDSHANVNSRCE
ncbi:13045_t:CDS:2 [Funneliformis geosporum]|nr:13045_t:CDS:2 [Funneliformis geosporum]